MQEGSSRGVHRETLSMVAVGIILVRGTGCSRVRVVCSKGDMLEFSENIDFSY